MERTLKSSRPAGITGGQVRRRFRVFISYSHKDRALVKQIAKILRQNGLWPMWDKNFAYGQGFNEQIKDFIAHAHVFLPVLTQRAHERNWVHQEIGYSTALHVPVLPVAVGALPGEMLHEIHALRMKEGDPESLRQHLTQEALELLIERHAHSHEPLYSCAELPEDRARMMSAFANRVLALGIRDCVRQKGALSSFHIPTETVGHSIWRRRYEPVKRSELHCRLQREERIALERHAAVAGCKLIINPYLHYEHYNASARICRLECLLSFLKEMDDERCQVAIQTNMDHRLSITLLGDWFSAESLGGSAEGGGYRQTMFTRHAPTVMEKLDDFDAEFDELIRSAKTTPMNSRRKAIEVIEREIDSAERALAAKAKALSSPSRNGRAGRKRK